MLKDRIHQYLILTRLNKPIGILLLLWPTLGALWLAAGGIPSVKLLTLFVLGVLIMRSAGCVINDVIDRKLDCHVLRTQQRPITSGHISVRAALILFLLLISMALLLVLQLNPFCFWLSIIGLLLSCCYPFMKRLIVLPQAFLGITFAWGIPMAYAATINTLPTHCWLLYLANLLWVVAYDTQYAMTDKEDDIKLGLYSSAIFFGQCDRIIIAILQCLSLLLLIVIGKQQSLPWPFYCGLGTALILVIYQQYLIRSRQPKACFQAFLNNHWLGLAIFIGLVFSLI